MDVFVKLIKRENPDYDPNHQRFKYGDLIQIDNRGIAVFVEHYPMEVECYVIKSTFGYKANTYAKVPYTRITKVLENNISNKIVWKSGYLVEDRTNLFVLLEKNQYGWHAICTKANGGGTYEGACYYLTNPYADYLGDK